MAETLSQKGHSHRLPGPPPRARSEALAVSVMAVSVMAVSVMEASVMEASVMAVWKMARETGLEPATSGVTGRRSNQLSYSRAGRLL
jgi:hypothetical protein